MKPTCAGNDKVCCCSITKNPIWPFELEDDDGNLNATLSVVVVFAQVNLWPSSSSLCCSWPTDLCESQTACSSQTSTSLILMWRTQSWRYGGRLRPSFDSHRRSFYSCTLCKTLFKKKIRGQEGNQQNQEQKNNTVKVNQVFISKVQSEDVQKVQPQGF